ncbi:MAG: hypothetical protein RIS45_1435 [Planctomycetota bacterium]|jgi:hypothetical protein
MPIPVRLTLGGSTMWRNVPSFAHADLCRAFSLDQASFSFDLPSTAYAFDKPKERVSGYVLRNGEPVGTLHVAREGERFRDIDPQADRFDLRQTSHN